VDEHTQDKVREAEDRVPLTMLVTVNRIFANADEMTLRLVCSQLATAVDVLAISRLLDLARRRDEQRTVRTDRKIEAFWAAARANLDPLVTELVTSAFQTAIKRQRPDGVVFHHSVQVWGISLRPPRTR
jgi:hypothetical protein